MRSCVLGALLLLGLRLPASAQIVQHSPEAVAALSACSSAMGALSTSSDFVAEGTYRRYFGKGNAEFSDERIVLKSKGATRHRTEIGPGIEKVYIISASEGHSTVDGERKRISYHTTAYHRPEHLPFALCGLDLQRADMQATYVGVEYVRGRTTFHIHLRSTDKDPARQTLADFQVFIDQQTGILLKTKSFVFSPEAVENHSDWEVFYSDFRRVGPRLLAFKIEHWEGGSHFSDLTFTSMRADVPVADAEFE